MNKIAFIFPLFVFIMVIISALFSLTPVNADYYSGKLFHYIGESNLTPQEALEIATLHSIGYMDSDFNLFTINDDGSVNVDYDFYSYDTIPFLNKDQSAIDSPWLHWFSSFFDGFGGLLAVVMSMSIFWVLIFIYFTSTPSNQRKIDYKFYALAWYLLHPNYLFDTEKYKENYSGADLVNKININKEPNGILSIRTWKYEYLSNTLHSTGAGNMQYKDKIAFSNKNPTEHNTNGLYSFRLGYCNTNLFNKTNILGIIEASGNYVEHADGIIRSEKLEILFILISDFYKKYASAISSRYKVPVMVCQNPILEYQRWMVSEQGIELMRHNYQIIRSSIELVPMPEKMIKEKAF